MPRPAAPARHITRHERRAAKARAKTPRKAYRPGRIDADPVGLAMAMAALLTDEQRAPIEQAVVEAFAAFRAGRGTARLWASLADSMNVAEALAQRRIASDHVDTFARAQEALAAVCARHAAGGSWTLYPAEITALDDAVFVACVQLRHCSQGELADAIHAVQRRIAAALRGDGPRGAHVCNPGLLGAQAGGA